MKFLAAVLAVLALVLAPYTVILTAADAASLPWHTFKESVPDVREASQGACEGEPILVARLEHDGKTYLYFAAENGRYLFAEMGENGPVMIFVGAQLPSPDQDVIKVLDAHPFSEGRDGTGPCDHLFPASA